MASSPWIPTSQEVYYAMPSSSRTSTTQPSRRPRSPVSLFAAPDMGQPKQPKPLVKIEKKPKKKKTKAPPVVAFSDTSSCQSSPTSFSRSSHSASLSSMSSRAPSLCTTHSSRSSISLKPFLRRIGIRRKRSATSSLPPDDIPPVPPCLIIPIKEQTLVVGQKIISSYPSTGSSSDSSSTYSRPSPIIVDAAMPLKRPITAPPSPSDSIQRIVPEPWLAHAPPSINHLPKRSALGTANGHRPTLSRQCSYDSSLSYGDTPCHSHRRSLSYDSSPLRTQSIQSTLLSPSNMHPPSSVLERRNRNVRNLCIATTNSQASQPEPPLSPLKFSPRSPDSPLFFRRAPDGDGKLRRPKSRPSCFHPVLIRHSSIAFRTRVLSSAGVNPRRAGAGNGT
ncbi:uncharacterized protein BT62DRAFT_247742 [Guyanagaster necrorhizus]|uniref:Uncharacterized protein n=1 Tax=Guyanagaster necrorhizus TaxID=856835 RepID=A0A9P8AS55_9AGAR|nr:uncharacterized protein BT62DRAFT_247742 [Guyanagaster necrorhizus MCA 3950]KAG7444532.1 hypothetical protein BT62DRAFT_247742 [Guyanagaster necrorhizus MCA 3950]